MNNKGYTFVELIIALGVFGIVFFAVAVSVSGTFDIDLKNDLYTMTIEAIEKQASIYGQINEDLFAEDDSVYLSITELAQANAIIASDGEGNVIDPRDNNKTINDLKVKITKEKDNKIVAKVLV